MRYMSYGLAIALMIAIVTTGASAQTSQSKTSSEPAKDKVPIDEKALDSFVGEAEHYFHQARESFFKKDMKTAADEIRKGAAFVKLEAGRATEAGKNPLWPLSENWKNWQTRWKKVLLLLPMSSTMPSPALIVLWQCTTA